MRKTLLASAAIVALGFSGYAMANPCANGDYSCNQKSGSGDNSLSNTASSTQGSTTGNNVNEVTGHSKVSQDSWNNTKTVAVSKLDGTVSHVRVTGIGNVATNYGNVNGGKGGDGARGIGGKGGSAGAGGG